MRIFDNRFQRQQTLTQSPKRRCAYEIVKNKTFLEKSLRCCNMEGRSWHRSVTLKLRNIIQIELYIEHAHFFLIRNLRIKNFGPLGLSCDFVLQCT